jgi:hypothetical protein
MAAKKSKIKNCTIVESKNICLNDRIGSRDAPPKVPRTKPIIGRPRVFDLKGNLLADEENLVVLIGREYLAQLIAGVYTQNPNNYLDYKITHFGVGSGGTSETCPPETVGPYDDDTDLAERVKINDDTLASGNSDDYIAGGYLKKITTDRMGHQGSIEILEETHTINTSGGGQITVDKYTAVKYTLYLDSDEPIETKSQNQPFRFNEAALYAVEYDEDTGLPVVDNNGNVNYILFARFTTLDKYLSGEDGLMIEWYILV